MEADSPPDAAGALPVDPAATGPEGAAADGPLPTQDITSFFIRTNASLGDTALVLKIDFGPDNRCLESLGVAGEANGSGPVMVTVDILDGERVGGWGASGRSNTVWLHVDGTFDSRDFLDVSGSQYATGSYSLGSRQGSYETFTIAMGMGPWESRILANASFAYELECQQPFDVVEARMGNEAVLLDETNLEGEANVYVSVAANAMVEAAGNVDLVAPESYFFMGSFGYQAGSVELRYPDGEASWSLPIDANAFLRSDPGHFEVEATRGAAYFDAFWLAFAGVSDDIDLGSWRHDSGILDNPFEL